MTERLILSFLSAIVVLGWQVAFAQDVSSWCPDGQKAFSAKKYEQANLALSSCLYSPPEDPAAAAAGYVMRGETYADRLDYEAALSDYDRAIELVPDYGLAWRDKAWAHYKRNELHPAISAINRSLEAEPYNTQSQHIKAQILTLLGRSQKAMNAYDLAYSFENPERVRKLQESLAGLDYDVGAADGVYGTQTREALKACIADGCTVPF